MNPKAKRATVRKWAIMRDDGHIVGLQSRRRSMETAVRWGGATWMWNNHTAQVVRVEVRVIELRRLSARRTKKKGKG